SVPFACDRLRRNEQGRFELEAPEDPEIVVFEYDADNAVLLPLSWNFDAKERFLFKKFHIQAQAIYSNLSYSPCETATDPD
ncbi:MAG: hypothetical protein OEQ74_04125, partial [Gammaproteobacteria bacterium]|nr:hypothetical protein [Gammaproteobacteria bacterium]